MVGKSYSDYVNERARKFGTLENATRHEEAQVNDHVRVETVELTDVQKYQITTLKSKINGIIDEVGALGQRREFSLAITKLEEAAMWATKGITGR